MAQQLLQKFIDRYIIKNGNIIIPDKPGFGLEWNENTLSKYKIDL